jgi:biopolymer transport protein ExbD
VQIQSQLNRRKKLSLTSLIDVIFLLLLFFMLSSTFSKYSKLEINAQAQGTGTTTQSRLSLVSIDGGILRLNGQLVDVNRLISLLSQDELNESQRAVITTTVSTTTQQLVDVLIELSNVEGLAVTIAR